MAPTDVSDPVKTASIIHEIKQPVFAMTMLAELTLDEMNETSTEKRDEKIKMTLEKILNQGQLCSRIIKKMENPAKNMPADFEPADINPIIIRALNKARYNGYDERITIRQNLEEYLPTIKVDQDAILQLMTNLITNAFDSMKNSSKKILTVSSHKTNQGISLKVTDTGCGIDKDSNKRIFDPFYTTKGADGMGLGLSICKTIINNHNGTITVNSRKNLGTQFNVFLPF